MTAHRALIYNSRGEIKGFGPRWSCDSFGEDGHDYYTCPHCMGRYLTWLSDVRTRSGAEA